MIRNTRQRDAILRSIVDADGPLSVAEIHEVAGREIAGLGIATVYRAIKTLKEEAKISVVELPGEEPRYEPEGRGHHHHFQCRSCDRTFDIHMCPVGIPEGTRLPGGYEIEDHSLTLYGLCSGCTESTENAS